MARIAVIIPARDEARGIGATIASLVGQPASALHIFVVDDGSTDGTAEAAHLAAAEAGKPEILTVIHGESLAPGWTGKMWAVQQGIEHALDFKPDFVLLTDADIVHEPGVVARLAGIARRDAADLVSLMVRLECESFADRLLIPAFVFFFFLLYPPRWIADPQAQTAGAAGGCMLVRREALERIGGVEPIRGEMIDDCALAAAIKRSGGRVWLGLADASASTRPYGTWGEIGNMIARSAFSQLRHSAGLLLGTVAGLSLMFLLPVALLFTGDGVAITLGALAWLAMAMCYLPMVRYYRMAIFRSLLLPAAAVFYMGATVVSAARYWTGRGGQWKGRAQDVIR